MSSSFAYPVNQFRRAWGVSSVLEDNVAFYRLNSIRKETYTENYFRTMPRQTKRTILEVKYTKYDFLNFNLVEKRVWQISANALAAAFAKAPMMSCAESVVINGPKAV